MQQVRSHTIRVSLNPILASLLLVLCVQTSNAGDFNFWVGEAHEDVTPSKEMYSGIYLGGYGLKGMRGHMKSVHDSIFVRALALRPKDSDQTVIFVSIDAIGVSNRLETSIQHKFAERFPNFKGRILISATHSHSAPDLMGLWGWVSPEYLNSVREKSVLAISRAFVGSREAWLWVAKGDAIAKNRRGWGFADSELTVLQAASATEPHSVIATMVNFAAHPTVLGGSNRALSRDFCGYLVDSLEKATGAPALFVNADEGDALPNVTRNQRTFEGANTYGDYLAEQTLAALKSKALLSPSLILMESAWMNPVTSFLMRMANRFQMLDYLMTLGGPNSNELEINFNITLVKLGELEALAVPGEVVTRLGMSIRNQMKSPFRMILGLTNGSFGYMMNSDEWKSGRNHGYEEKLSLDRRVGERMADEAANLLMNMELSH